MEVIAPYLPLAINLMVLLIAWSIRQIAVREVAEARRAVAAELAVVRDALAETMAKERERRRADVSELRDRLGRVESRLEDTPTSRALHELAMSIGAFGGDLKGIVARLDGMGQIVGRLEKVVQRQEDYLLRSGGGKS